MNTRYLLSCAFVVACAGVAFGVSAAPAPATPAPAAGMRADAAAPVAAPKLQAALRSLWHEHVVHTRDYALAVHAHNAAKAKAAEDAVVSNAKAIAGAVGGFYGKPAGEQMFKLLAGHWGGVKALTDAVSAHDAAGQTAAMNTLNTNAAAIAKFLSGANPYLPDATLMSLLEGHVAHHSAQIHEIMAGDMKAEASTWTAMQQHMNVIADALAAGIAKQFPTKAN